MMLQSVIGALFLCGVSFAFPGRIVQGVDTDITEIPYQVSIQLVRDNYHFCGGAILNEKWILTAGHCVETESRPTDKQVVVGMTKQSEGGVVHTIRKIIRDSRFGNNHRFSHDIAVIELMEPIVFNERAQPVQLPKDSQILPIGKECKVGGWGRLSQDGPSPDHLQSTTMPIWEPKKCAEAFKYPESFFVGSSAPMICANWEGGVPNTCNGDSGGPLVCDGVQYGIVSFGRGCANPNYPLVFSHVYNLRDFISRRTGIKF